MGLDACLADWSGQTGFPISYEAIPGRVRFFNVTGKDRSNGGSVYGGTADDGETRNFIYQDASHLETTAVHAGLRNVGERGIVRVTLLPSRESFLASDQVSKDGDTRVVGDAQSGDPGDDPYSFRIDLYRVLDTD